MASLRDIRVRNPRPRDPAYKPFDGRDPFLLMTPSGGRLWRLKYRWYGREKLISLGAYPDVTDAKPPESSVSSCPSESLRVPDAPSTTCVPAELRLNWGNVARVARMRRFATPRIRAHRRIGVHRPSGQPPQLSDGGIGDRGGFVRGLSARITDNQLTSTGAL